MSDPTSVSPIASSLSSIETFSGRHARDLVKEYARGEEPSDRTSKVLFAFLDYLPSDSAVVVADDIISYSGKLHELADHYVSTILFPIRASGGKTPSAVSTRPGPDNIEDVFTKITPQNRDQGKLRSACLARDNNRCLLSGLYDSKMALEVLSDTERQDVETVSTEAAHILPYSLSSFSESEHHYKATIWEGIFHMFPNLRDFSSADINDPRNALTLWNAFHDEFGSFRLCLEPSAIPNRYYIKRYRGFSTYLNRILPNDGFVTFTAHDGRYALPDGYLLSIHASVGAVLHASGMAETIEHALQERDELRCLATDGSTQVGLLLMAF
ncbi:MAG: hypothetical protein M1839_005433 [Geoglossum umbratile]|nr:MAG: hypothetical protein M1839_005433 [Geoglossum umbratile]